MAVFVAIGLWGHATHWTFSFAHGDVAHAASDVHPDDPSELIAPQTTVSPELFLPADKQPPVGVLGRIVLVSPKAATDLGIRCAAPQTKPLSRELTASGVVNYEPSRLAQLSARVPGSVWRVEKQVGQRIRAGDVLAIIDATAVGQAKADFLRAIAEVKLREKVYERLNSFSRGEVPGQQIEQAATELRKARVDLFNAQQALISLGLPIKLAEWENLSETELQDRIKFLGLPSALVSQLDPNATTASLLPVLAPFEGIVTGRDLAIGEIVSPAESHFEIADVSRMWIVLNVREQDSDELELGQKVQFTAGSASVTGPITWMSTAVDPKTRTLEVRCEVDNPELKNKDGKPLGKRLLRANEFGIGRICLQENSAALVVPTSAVQRSNDSAVIFVQTEPRVYEARKVRVGVVGDDYTEIAEGLQGDDQVVVEGSHIFKAELQRAAASNSQS
jgi:cobalt-zinc-cadmium efflux system membrane fusion protein